MQNPFVKKALVVGSSLAMALSTMVAAGTVQAASHAIGTNVVSNGTVYFIDSNNQLRPYTSAGAFLSYGFNSWSNVVAASAEDMALTRGSFVPPMDGSLINDHGTVYLMTNGQRAGFTSAANFLGLGYSFANVIPGDTSFLPSASLINSTAMTHSVGTLVNDHGTVYLMTASGKMGIPSLSVFNSWGYSFSKVVPANSYDSAVAMSSGIMQARAAGQLNPTGSSVVIPPVNSGNLSVSLASDSPAAGTLVAGQAAADLAHFTFYGTGTVTSVNLKRIGVSADTTPSAVYLYDGSTRLTDSSVVTSGSTINFSNGAGLFTVNGSRTITVRSDIAASTGGQTVGVQLVSAMSGSNAVSGTPVNGNVFTIASVTGVASYSFGSTTPSTATVTPANDQVVWQNTISLTGNDTLLTRLALKEIGSINSSDLQNFRLFVDGNQVATASGIDANGYVTFTPNTVLKSGNRTLKVLADVVGGSSRTYSFSLQNAADLGLTDTVYNVGIAPSSFTAQTTGTQTISAGQMTAQKAVTSPSSNVTLTASDAVLGDWTLTATGEPIKVTTLNVAVTAAQGTGSSVSGLNPIRNARLLVNGSQVGNTQNLTLGSSTAITTNFVVNPGSPVTVELRADVNTSTGTNFTSGNTLQATLKAGTNNAQGQTSFTLLNVPGSDVSANALTIASGSISLAKNATYGNQTTVVPQSKYHLASLTLSGNSTEDVNINSIVVNFSAVSSGTFDQTDLNNVYVVLGTMTTPVKATPGASNTWSVNYVLPKNATVPLDVYGDIASGAITAGDAIQTSVQVTGTTAQSGAAVTTGTATTAQQITYNTGSVTVAVDPSSPSAAITSAAQSGKVVAAYKFTATNDTYTITDMDVKFSGTNAGTVVSNVNLMNGGTVLASKPLAGSDATFSGLNIQVPANGSVVVTVSVDLNTVGVGAGASNSDVVANLYSYKVQSSTGAVTSATPSSITGKDIYVYKAIPTVTVTASTSALFAGTENLATMTVNSNGGAISWDKAIFTVSLSGTTPTATSWTLKDASGNSVASCSATGTAPNYTVTCTASSEQQVSGSATYTLGATVAGTFSSTDRASVVMSHASSANAAGTAAGSVTSANFVWSDISAVPHDTTTSDWYNDYLVQNLQ